VGLLLLTCPECGVLQEKEQVSMNPRGLQLISASKRVLQCDPVPNFLLDMVQAGGLLNQLKLRHEM
jgi:3-isopropylmalate/(R)-2-methylmalate dehydratase small subunit